MFTFSFCPSDDTNEISADLRGFKTIGLFKQYIYMLAGKIRVSTWFPKGF